MAVTPNDLKGAKGGALYESVFTGLDNFDAQLQAWIDGAPSDASDETVKAYANKEAFAWKVQHESLTGSSVSKEGVGSISKDKDQRNTWRDLMEKWERIYDERRAEEEGEPDPTPPLRSQSVSSTTSWV